MMRPEEWYARVENSIDAMVAAQGRHQVQMEDLLKAGQAQSRNLAVLAESVVTLVHKVDALSDTVRSHEARTEELREYMRSHEGKIDALVHIVDRIIRREHPEN